MNIREMKNGVSGFRKKFKEAWEIGSETDRTIVFIACCLFGFGMFLAIVRIILAFVQGGD